MTYKVIIIPKHNVNIKNNVKIKAVNETYSVIQCADQC